MGRLEVKHLTKKYDNTIAVSDMSFVLETGVYGLLGPNGAGKSTLMKMLTLQLFPSSGKILWEGNDVSQIKEDYLGKIGYMPQQQILYPTYSVEEFVYYMAMLHGMDYRDASISLEYLLKKVGLKEKRKEKIRNLSGGMKQRLLLVQALIHHPDIIILDEPTAGLDPQQRIAVRNLIVEFASQSIILLATHVVQDIELISKETLLMKEGSLIAMGTHRDLCENLKNKVFEFSISKKELTQYLDEYLISTVKEDIDGKYLVRVITEEKPRNIICKEVAASLEDVFLYYFGRESVW